MAKKFISCPFCGGKIKDSAIKCMHCKKWLNVEEKSDSQVKEKIEPEVTENYNKVESKISKNNNDTLYVNDKSMLWWIIGFQLICLLGALVNIL